MDQVRSGFMADVPSQRQNVTAVGPLVAGWLVMFSPAVPVFRWTRRALAGAVWGHDKVLHATCHHSSPMPGRDTLLHVYR